MNLKQILVTTYGFLAKMYRVDLANHFMRGSVVAGSTSSAVIAVMALLVVFFAPPKDGVLLWMALMLFTACVVGAVSAWLAGEWNEKQDQKANDAADAAGQPHPHTVETADWQFTAWGALPVCVPLLVASISSLLLSIALR